MQQFASFYFPGTHGSWLVWFINQHANFSKEKLGFLQTYYNEGDTGHDYQERQVGHVVCNEYNNYTYYYKKDSNGNEIPITDFTCDASDWYYHFESFDKYMNSTYNNESLATKNAFKVLDHHFPVWNDPVYNGVDKNSNKPYEDDPNQKIHNQRKLLSQLLLESNAFGIIMPLVKDTFKQQLLDRFNVIRLDATYKELEITEEMIRNYPLPLIVKDKTGRIRKIYDIPNITFEKVASVPLLFVDIVKLINCDQEEYNKLLNFISEKEIPCWKDLINNTVMKVYEDNKLL